MNKHLESFLWSQNSSSTEDSWFVIDGKVSKYCRSKEQMDAMLWMTNTKFNTVAKHQKDDETSLSYEIKTSSGATQLIGNFQEKDESGRPLVYVLTTRKKLGKEILATLRQYADLLKLTLRENDINAYLMYFEKKKRIIVLSCLVLGVVLILLMRNC